MLDRKCQLLFMSTATRRTTTNHRVPQALYPQSPPPLIFIFSASLFSLSVISGMTGNYLLTNPLLRTHDTNPYNNLLAETVVCNTPSPPAFHSPGAHPPPFTLLFLHRFVFALKPDILENALPGERNLRRSKPIMCLQGKQPFSLAQN